MNTRANAAGRNAKTVQNVAATTPEPTAPTSTPPADTTEPTQDEPLASAAPLLLRLEPSILFKNDDLDVLQPQLGASVTAGLGMFGRHSKETGTIWLPAAAWDGMALIIRQTPNWHRENVATFVASHMGGKDVLTGLLEELVEEVRSDPYGDVPESTPNDFDFAW
jgi:hypothetical protein